MELIQYPRRGRGKETADSILTLEDTAWPRADFTDTDICLELGAGQLW